MTRTKSSRALVSVVLAVLMAVAFMPAISYTSFAATAKKATKVTKVYHTGNKTYTRTVGSAWTLKYKLSPSKLTAAAKKVVWKSSNKSVVSVSAKSGNKAAVSFKKAGTATVTVYTKANKKAKASWKFKVVNKTTTQKVAATGVTVKANNSTDYTKTLTAGTILTATVAPANATGVTYQWYADGTPISGATSAQFTVTGDQIGKKITVKAKANTGDEVTSAESAKVENITVNDLTIYNTTAKANATTGANSIGDKLEVQYAGADNAWVVYPADYGTIQWYRTKEVAASNGATTIDTQAISGATSATYTVTKADAGYNLYAVVTPASSVKVVKKVNDMTGVSSIKDGAYTLKKSTAVAGVKNITAVNISVDDAVLTEKNNTVKSGTVLTAVTDPKSAADVVDYQWYKNGYKIDGATSATYTATDAGSYTVKVSLKSGEGNYKITGTGISPVEAKVEAAKTAFSNVTVTNDTASKANRTTNEIGDSVYVNVSGVNPSNYTVKWYKVNTNKYGESADTELTKLTTATSVDGYVGIVLPNSLNNGDQIYAVVTGKDNSSYANYESKTNTLTITTSATAIGTLSSSLTTSGAGVTTIKNITIALPSGYDNATVEWEKAPYNVVGSNTSRTFTSTGSKGTTYELNTTESSATFSIRAKITKADGTVEYSAVADVVTGTNGSQTFTVE